MLQSTKILSLYHYPLKSGAPISLDEAYFNSHSGFSGDRAFVVAHNSTGRFLSSRRHPVLVNIECKFNENEAIFSFVPNNLECKISLSDFKDFEFIDVWKRKVKCRRAPCLINEWFSELLREPVFLCQLDSDELESEESIGLFDTGLVHLVNKASILRIQELISSEAINELIFRPNIVIEEGEGFIENTFDHVKIGGHLFRMVEPAQRCLMVTRMAKHYKFSQPEKLLQILTPDNTGVEGLCFGVYLKPLSSGRLTKGVN